MNEGTKQEETINKLRLEKADRPGTSDEKVGGAGGIFYGAGE